METFLGMEVEQLDGKIRLNLGKYISLQAECRLVSMCSPQASHQGNCCAVAIAL